MAKKDKLPPWKSPMRVLSADRKIYSPKNDIRVNDALDTKCSETKKEAPTEDTGRFWIRNIWVDIPTGFDYTCRSPSPQRSVRDNYSDIEPLSPDSAMIDSYLEDLEEGMALGLLTQP